MILLVGMAACSGGDPERGEPSGAEGLIEGELAEPGFSLVPLPRCESRRSQQFSIFAINDATDEIVRFDPTTDSVAEVVALPELDVAEAERIDTPYDLAVSRERDIYVANFGTGSVNRFDAQGSFRGVVYFDRQVLEEPTALRFSGDALWVVGNDSRNLVRLDPIGGGLMQSVAGDGAIPWPLAVALDPSGEHAFVTATSAPVGERIQVWSLRTSELVERFGGDELDHVLGIEIGCDGGVYVSTTDTVIRYQPSVVIEGTPYGPFRIERSFVVPGVRRLKSSPDGRLFATADDGLVRLDEDATGWEAVNTPEGMSLRSFAFAPR